MKIIAHRGASGTEIENTLVAFEQAIIEGCDGIELDIQYHPSGEFFLLHDSYIDYQGKQTHLHALSVEQIAAIRLKNKAPIATLSQAFNTISNRCPINIEIKSSSLFTADCISGYVDEMLKLLNQQINQAIAQNLICPTKLSISSFNHKVLKQVAKRLPNISLGALTASCPNDLAKFGQALACQSVNPAIDCITKDFVDDAHQRGLSVWVYTVNNPQDIALCNSLNVDAIFTDFPEKSRAIFNQIRQT